jgi:hypothetical protein
MARRLASFLRKVPLVMMRVEFAQTLNRAAGANLPLIPCWRYRPVGDQIRVTIWRHQLINFSLLLGCPVIFDTHLPGSVAP